MNKTNKAYEKLKNYVLFSPNYQTFESFFWENLNKEQTDLAIELLLRVVYKLLTSPGEKFNELLDAISQEDQNNLKNWLDEKYKEKVENV